MTLEDDAYAKENATKFATDMTGWPPVEYGHIFSYFIARYGVYILEQLLCWKQLESYNYFQSNYVRTVYVRKIGNGADELCILKATVKPSQRAPDKANQAWILVKLNGHVVTAHCTCMAGWVILTSGYFNPSVCSTTVFLSTLLISVIAWVGGRVLPHCSHPIQGGMCC